MREKVEGGIFVGWLLVLVQCCQNCPGRSIFTRAKEAVLTVDMGAATLQLVGGCIDRQTQCEGGPTYL